jgi:chromosome segregation ATPase
MDLSDWMILHADDLLLGAGVLVTLVAAVFGAVYGCELTLRGVHRVGLWRVKQLHQAQQAMAIRLEMESRTRRHRDQAEQPECARLRRAATAAELQIQELRQLLQAQQEVLAGRAGSIEILEQASTRAAGELSAAQTLAAERLDACAAISQERDQAADARDQLAGELNQRDQVISMLDRTLATHRHAADLAQAGLADARVQLELVQEKLQAALARCELLAEIQEVRSQRGPDPAAHPSRRLIAR